MSTPGDEIYMPPTEPQAPMPMQGGMAPTKMKISESSSGGGWGNVDQDQKSIFEDLIQRRREGADQIQGKLASLGPRPGGAANMDLSLLAGAVDSFTDGETNFSQTYKAPTRTKEFDQNKANLEKALTEQQNSLSDDQLKYLSAMAQSEDRKLQRQLLMETAKQRNEIKAGNQDTNLENTLRKEWLSGATTKNSLIMKDGASTLEKLGINPSPAGDMAMLYSFFRILDPTSTVRETEYAAAASAAGLGDKVSGYIERIQRGEKLTPMQRQDFVRVGKELYRKKLDSQRGFDEGYISLAKTSGVDPDRVVMSKNFFGEAAQPGSIGSAPAPAAGPPKVGDVVNGYEYIGGSPGAQQSWRKK